MDDYNSLFGSDWHTISITLDLRGSQLPIGKNLKEAIK